MPKPTADEIKAAIQSHAKAVGKANVSVLEVALSLDSLCGDMTEAEFAELKVELTPLISEVRFLGQLELWAPTK